MSMNSQKSAPVHYPGSVFPKTDQKLVKNPEEKVTKVTPWDPPGGFPQGIPPKGPLNPP